MSSPPICENCGLRTDRLSYFLPHCTCNPPIGNHYARFPSNFIPNYNAGKSRFKGLGIRAANSLHLAQYLLSNDKTFKYGQKKQLRIKPNGTLYLPRNQHLFRKLKEDKLFYNQLKEAKIKVKHYSAANTIEESDVIYRIKQFKIYYHI